MKKRHVLLVTFLVPIVLTQVFRMVLGFPGLFVGIVVSVAFIFVIWRHRAAYCRLRALEILDSRPDGVSGKDIGRRVYLTAPYAFLESLVESGHLEKVWRQEYVQDPYGGQIQIKTGRYTLAPKGREELARHRVKHLPQAKTV